MKIQMEPQITEDTIQTSKAPKPEPEHPDALRRVKIGCLILAILLFVAGVRTIGTIRTLQATIANQKTRIERLTKEKKALSGEEVDEADASEGTEEEADRNAIDAEISKAFLKQLLTWDSYDSYAGVRSWLMEDYGIAAEDQLLTVFMPELSEETLGSANMAFDRAQTYVVHENGDAITYFSLCSVTNKNDSKDTGYGHVGVFYTIDGEGNISSISADTLAN